ncbi:MAG: hypothetical protein COB38_09795 [Gammaproteobacteria bacterium]|nr:MAG: hypothetical protein COB38_09795 [Gammaproteobacteria bacterium]
MISKNTLTLIIISLLTIFFTGCSSEDEEINGTLSLSVSDGPIDNATEVVVVFSAIELKPKEGAPYTITFSEARSINLLGLQNGESAPLLQNESLEAGDYNWMRLLVDANEGETDSYITLDDGTTHSLYIPSGSETGLKINRSFTIAVGESVNFMIDFDLRKSVLAPNNQSDGYKLKPVLRVTDLTEVGSITGFVDASLVSDESCTEGLAIYAYIGADVTPDDEGSATSPLTTAIPVYESANDRFNYTLSFLSAGDYTVSVTCDADLDSADIDDSEWGVIESLNGTVIVDQITELNFE